MPRSGLLMKSTGTRYHDSKADLHAESNPGWVFVGWGGRRTQPADNNSGHEGGLLLAVAALETRQFAV